MATRAQISGIDYYLPQSTLDNNELARIFPEWSASKIEEKTGVRIRHIAAPHETAADMAVKAAQRLFEKRKCTPDDIDFVILCTESPDYPLPPSACLIQDRLRIPSTAGALDYNLACSGFVYGLALAQGLIETGIARNVLLLTAETYTKYMHPLDRSVRTLFGDGSAATLIRGVESDPASDLIGPFVFGTDGSGGEHLIVRGRGHRISESTAERGHKR